MKNKLFYKSISLFLALIMFTTLLPEVNTQVYAENEQNPAIEWEFIAQTGTLKIEGTGDMPDFKGSDETLWKEHRDSISRVEIGEGVTSIGNFAFSGYSNITSVSIADSVRRIGASAFSYCEMLSEITIPANVSEIGSAAFVKNTSLSGFSVDSANENYTALNGVLMDEKKERIISYPAGRTDSTYRIPSTVGVLEPFAFYSNKNILRLEVPASVTDIKMYALADTVKLANIVYSGTMAMWNSIKCGENWNAGIGSNTFNGGCNLNYSQNPPSTATGKCGDNLTWTFNASSSMITISGTGEMYNYTDRSAPWRVYRDYIASATIESGVTTIGDYAFSECISLKVFRYKNDLDRIGEGAFYYCTNLSVISTLYEADRIENYAFAFCGNLLDAYFPGTTYIGDYAFHCCLNMKNITIGSCEEGIGQWAFGYNRKLETISYEGKVIMWELIEKGENWDYEMSISTASGKPQITCFGYLLSDSGSCGDELEWEFNTTTGELTISGTGDMEEYESTDLPWKHWRNYITSVTVSEGVKSISASAFYGCKNIKSVQLSQTLEKIGESAFYGCTLLARVQIPQNVKKLYRDAFKNCTSLKYVSIPKQLSEIESGVFEGCSGLAEIFYPGTEYKWNKIVKGEGWDLNTGSYTLTIGDEPEALGTIGEDIKWEYREESKTLKIYGTGEMNEISKAENIPWNDLALFIEKAEISDGITNICNYAFYNCSELQQVTIGKNIETIGAYAFGECPSITSIELLESVTTINEGAFLKCTSLTSIELPDSVVAIANIIFSGCNNLAEIKLGEALTEIGNGAFYNCSALTEINLSGTVTKIGNSVFSGCTALAEINLPEAVTQIGKWAFSGCSSLTEISVPPLVTTLAQEVFYGCSSLEKVYLNENITLIEAKAFAECTNLKEICWKGNNVTWDAVTKNSNWSYNAGTATENGKFSVTFGEPCFYSGTCGANLKWELREETKELIISGTGVMSQWSSSSPAPWSEYSNLIKKVTITDGVTSIGSYAFYNCNLLERADIADTVTLIDNYAFYGCSALKSMNIPQNATNIGSYAFYDCSSLESVEIPLSVTNVGAYAFYGCSSLNNVTLNEGLTEIGEYAFYGCNSITEIRIPLSVGKIGKYAFANCTNIEDIYYIGSEFNWSDIEKGTSWDNKTGSNTTNQKYTLHCETENSYSGTKDGISWVLWLERGLLEITGEGAFFNASSQNYVPWYNYRQYIRSVAIDERITNIGKYAFFNCTLLESVDIPDNVTNIGTSAFYGCSGLKNINFSENITSISVYAFNGCTSLTNINLPSKLKYIDNHAFVDCTKLASINIPESVTSIGSYAFEGCVKLADVYYAGSNGSWKNVSKGLYWDSEVGKETANKSYTLHCAKLTYYSGECGDNLKWSLCEETQELEISGEGTMYDFETNSPWYSYNNNIKTVKIGEGVTSIGKNAFASYYIENVTLADSITSIGQQAFKSCASLKSLSLPKNLTSIGESAFSGCKLLESVSFSDSLASIGKNAFFNCDSLKNISLPESLVSIGESAFSGCDLLENISLPESLVSIGDSAFSNCDSLKKISLPDSLVSMGIGAFSQCDLLEEVKIGEGITEIAKSTFQYCNMLKAVYIPKSVKTIRENAFANCKALADIYYAGSEMMWINELIFESGWNTFAGSSVPNGKYTVHFGMEDEVSDECGENLNWTFNSENGILEISGEGAMFDWTNANVTPWNKYSTQIKTIKIGEGVTYIGNYAFSGLTALTGVNIPESITQIGKYSISDCTSLISINYAGSESDWLAIKKDSSWNEGTADFTVYYAKANAVSGQCGDNLYWEFSEETNHLKISGSGAMYTASNSNDVKWNIYKDMIHTVEIGKGITNISKYAFKDLVNLSGIYYDGSCMEWEGITKGMAWNSQAGTATAKGKYTLLFGEDFYDEGYCMNGAKWEFFGGTGTLKFSGGDIEEDDTIPMDAPWLDYMELINTIEFGQEVYSIGENGLKGYPIENIIISESVNSIGSYAFRDCTNVKNIYYMGEEPMWDSVEKGRYWDRNLGSDVGGYNVYFVPNGMYHYDEDGTTWELYEDGRLHIMNMDGDYDYNNAPWSMWADKISVIEIDECVTRIGDNAFASLFSLERVELPQSISEIGENTFAYCTNLAQLNFYGTKTQWETMDKGSMWDFGAGKLQPEGKYSLYYEEDPVTSGECGQNVSWEYIKDTNVLKISGSGEMTDYEGIDVTPWFRLCEEITKVVIEEGVTSIGDCALGGLYNATRIEIAESVNRIGEYALADCYNVNTVYFAGKESQWNNIVKEDYWDSCLGSDTSSGAYTISFGKYETTGTCGENLIWEYDVENATLKISGSGEMTSGTGSASTPWYRYMSSIREVIITEGVTSVGNYAFYRCLKLEYLSLPDSLTAIGENAFYGCSNLRILVLPGNVRTLGSKSFDSCTRLTDIILLDGMESIPSSVFGSCSNIRTLVLPLSLTSIGSGVFSTAKSLTDIYYGGSEAEWKAMSRGMMTLPTMGKYTIHYNDYESGLYRSGSCTESVTWELDKISGVLKITGEGAMPDYSAFSAPWSQNKEITDIRAVEIEEGITSIGSYAFSGGTGILRVTLPSTLMNISDNAFKGCTDLKNVEYDSDESDWDKITIGTENTALTDVDISFKEAERSVVLDEDSIEVTMSGNESAILVLVSYNGEEMLSVRYKEITGGYTQSLSESGLVYSGGNTIKAFLWKDMNSITPLCEAKSLTLKPYIVLNEDRVSIILNEGQSAILALASYNGEEMVSVRYKQITGEYSQVLSETGLTYSAGNTVKAFLWKDMKTIMPLGVSKSLTIREQSGFAATAP